MSAVIHPERTTNPEYVDRGAWFVDDGMGLEFFATEEAAQRYADRCIADDQHDADRRTLAAESLPSERAER